MKIWVHTIVTLWCNVYVLYIYIFLYYQNDDVDSCVGIFYKGLVNVAFCKDITRKPSNLYPLSDVYNLVGSG